MRTRLRRRRARDFLWACVDLSAEEKGVYATLGALADMQGPKIVDDPRSLARVCGVSTRKFNIIVTRLVKLEKLDRADGFLNAARRRRNSHSG